MRNIQANTEHCPYPEGMLFCRPIQSKQPDRRVVQAIQHACTGCEVVQLLSDIEVPRMENHAEDPTCETKVTQEYVVWPEAISRRYGLADLCNAVLMGQEVHQGEEDREGLLYSKKPIEGPFPMILNNWTDHRRISRNPTISNDMLAGVVAFGGACPEQETKVERCHSNKE